MKELEQAPRKAASSRLPKKSSSCVARATEAREDLSGIRACAAARSPLRDRFGRGEDRVNEATSWVVRSLHRRYERRSDLITVPIAGNDDAIARWS